LKNQLQIDDEKETVIIAATRKTKKALLYGSKGENLGLAQPTNTNTENIQNI